MVSVVSAAPVAVVVWRGAAVVDGEAVVVSVATSPSSSPPHAASRAEAPKTEKPIIPRRRMASRLVIRPRA